jgi:hypothetical protein
VYFAVYRASFCQTFVEMQAPTGEWKAILAGIFTALAFTGWILIYMKKCGKYQELLNGGCATICVCVFCAWVQVECKLYRYIPYSVLYYVGVCVEKTLDLWSFVGGKVLFYF